jgi:hypothetical protein
MEPVMGSANGRGNKKEKRGLGNPMRMDGMVPPSSAPLLCTLTPTWESSRTPVVKGSPIAGSQSHGSGLQPRIQAE